jgi:hypothetical protein
VSGRLVSWLIVLIVPIVACGGGSAPDASEPAPTTTSVASTSVSPSTAVADIATTTTSTEMMGVWYGGLLAVGDCFDDTIDADGDYVYTGEPLIVPCVEPHDNEVIGVHLMAEGTYPGSEALEEEGDELCPETFVDVVGVEWSESPLSDFWIWPGEDEWGAGGREIVCAVYLSDHKIRGSVQASGTSARPAEIPDHVPVPAEAVFQRVSDTEEGERVGMFAVDGSLDEIGAATVAAAADSGLELRLDGRTASLLLFRYAVEGVEYTIAIHGKDDGADWWIYYPPPDS